VFFFYVILKDAGVNVAEKTNICGILSIEHAGKPPAPSDGLCLCILVSIKDDNNIKPQIQNTAKYTWHRLKNGQTVYDLNERITKDNTVPLFIL